MKRIFYANSEVQVEWEDAFNMVVIARDEKEARQIASKAEANDKWLDENKTTFAKIGNASNGAKNCVVCSDIKYA